jgi:hypothetical protein
MKDHTKDPTTEKPLDLQRQWKTGKVYELRGHNRKRRVVMIGRARINGQEVLLMRPLRAAAKFKPQRDD